MPSSSSGNTPRRTPTRRCSSRCASRSTSARRRSSKLLVDTQPKQLDAVLEFADRAYRRPLTDAEKDELRGLYRKLREQELPHDEAIRLTLARVLVAPAFLYRVEKPAPGDEPGPVTDWELASRLSYFLWSSHARRGTARRRRGGQAARPGRAGRADAADAARPARAPAGDRVRLPVAAHPRLRRSSTKRASGTFPTFAGLRGAMYEESIRFFTDLFQHDGSVLNILDADYTFLNEALAKHYGIPGVTGAEWRRVDGVKKFGAAAFSARRRRWPSNPAHRAPARSCAATGSARCCSARSCRARRRTCRACPRTKRPPRA